MPLCNQDQEGSEVVLFHAGYFTNVSDWEFVCVYLCLLYKSSCPTGNSRAKNDIDMSDGSVEYHSPVLALCYGHYYRATVTAAFFLLLQYYCKKQHLVFILLRSPPPVFLFPVSENKKVVCNVCEELSPASKNGGNVCVNYLSCLGSRDYHTARLLFGRNNGCPKYLSGVSAMIAFFETAISETYNNRCLMCERGQLCCCGVADQCGPAFCSPQQKKIMVD